MQGVLESARQMEFDALVRETCAATSGIVNLSREEAEEMALDAMRERTRERIMDKRQRRLNFHEANEPFCVRALERMRNRK